MRLRLARGLAFLSLASGCVSPASPPAAELESDGRLLMGTVLELSVADPGGRAAARARLARAFAEVARLEAIFSRHDPASELADLNRAAGRGRQRVSPELFAILARSRRAARETEGSFDVTLAPLVALWVEAAERNRLPDAAAVEQARRAVDARRIDLHPPDRAALPGAGMAVDLGGIAKGWSLDRLAERWRDAGIGSALLSFGQSSAIAIGAPPGDDAWRLWLRDAHGDIGGVLELRDVAFSVSSSLGQWSEIEGRRLGHVIDPRSGWPLERAARVAVVAPDATTAEIWSTAALVLGPERGLARLERLPQVEAQIVDDTGGIWETSGWRERTRFEPWTAPSTAGLEPGAGS